MVKKVLSKIKGLLYGKNGATALDSFIGSIRPQLKTFETVLDVGAYHGDFVAEILAANNKINVHVFEPFGASFKLIGKRFKDHSNVTVNHAAVSDMAGLASLHVNSFKETNSLLESSNVNEAIDSLTKKESTEQVAVISLDEYCREKDIHTIDLVKIDTQGNSYNVLKGMEKMLLEKKVAYLYVEAEFVEIYRNEKLFSEIEMLMRSYGYGIVNIYNLNYIDGKRLGWCDVLFSPKN